MFDVKHFEDVKSNYEGLSTAFVFFDSFTKKFGPLNVATSFDEAIYISCNYLKSVEDKNISLSHISVYVCGSAFLEDCVYNLHKPMFLFNASDYKEVYSHILESFTFSEVSNEQ